jgi:uncharacterized protein (TIGR02118 family)
MVMISIMYPNRSGSKFDQEYYINTHMPMSIERLSTHAGFRGVSVVRGMAGGVPNSEPAYVAICQFLFDSLEDFLAAFNPHAAFLQGDMLNYTDSEPTIQISAVEIMR